MAYTKDFQYTAILTSQNPTAFLTFRYNTPYDVSYWIVPECSIGVNMFFVNGWDVDSSATSKKIALELNPNHNVASFFLYTSKYTDFDVSLRFKLFDSSTYESWVALEDIDVAIKNRPTIIESGEINTFINDAPLIENEASYTLLRTNPKFSGNIKLVIDENNKLYLDTFKVSQILSNRYYRKQQISANSVYSGDVHTIFKTLPVGELYKLDSQDTLNISIPKIDINQQYSTTYNYGARLLKDDLYDEDYSLLAPIWINSKLPDYFAIFRLGGVHNSSTYDPTADLLNLANQYFEEGELIKSWSIKEDKPLGKYLRTHVNELIQNPAPVYLSLNQYDPNTWYGIAINKGIITGRSEVPYFFNQIASNFTHMNAWVSGGFERQNLLCPNLLNLEYVFNDNDVSLYSMHRYYGLYLSENELYRIAYYANSPSDHISILSLDGKDSSIFMHSLVRDGSGNVISSLIFDGSGNITSIYKNRIFVLNDGNNLSRITNVNQIDGTNASTYLNLTKDNIFNVQVTKKEFNPFIIIKINEILDQGEHLRIISKSKNKAWEVYGVSDIVKKGDCWPYASQADVCTNRVDLYRVAFSVDGDITDQIKAIEKAFDLFANFEESVPFRIGIRKDNMFSLILNYDLSSNDYMFQRITSNNNSETYGKISLFGVHTTTANDYISIDVSSFYGPIDFEFYGSRKSIFCDLIQSNNYFYSFSNSVINKIEPFTFYQGLDKWFRLILDFDISTQSSQNLYKYIYDPLTLENNILIMTDHEIRTINGWWNAYNIKPLSISLMGINPVKDIDYTIYDASRGINLKSEYWYVHEGDASTYQRIISIPTEINLRNSYLIIGGKGTITINGSTRSFDGPTANNPFTFNTFDGSAYINPINDTTITYNILNGTHSFVTYDPAISEENIYDYYVGYDPTKYFNLNDISTGAGTLKYSLTVPQVSKWVSLGNDCRNNPFRLILKNLFVNKEVYNTNFIPLNSSNFRDEISYPSYKYLDSGVHNWKDYVYYDINDVISYVKDGSIVYTTIKKLMFEKPTLDVFSKLMYSNNNFIGATTRSSIVYYNQFKQTIDTITSGLSFSLKVESIASGLLNIKNYDRYRFGFISTTCRNYNNNYPIEVIINENTSTILMIWYQGNDLLLYSKRNSTLLPGKSLLRDNGDNPDFQAFTVTDVSKYTYIRSPFYLNYGNTLTITNYYSDVSAFNSIEAAPILQHSFNFKTNLGSIFNGWGTDYYTTSYNNTFIGYSNTVYTTFSKNQGTVYNYVPNTDIVGKSMVNHAYKYSSNINLYPNDTCDINLLQYFLNLNKVYYHIIRGNEVLNSDSFYTTPMVLSINAPTNYNVNSSNNFYTYNGWYKPKFNNILSFNSNENSNLINTVQKDFMLSNTNIDSYHNIPQLWYNKVVTAVTNYDVSIKNAIDYINNFNVFKAQWDSNYYVLIDSCQNKTYLNGYKASQELPSFFGSKLIKLPDSLVLDTWDTTSTTSEYNNDTITLTFNLTKGIQNLFKNKKEFVDNWKELPNYSDSDIDNYITNTILTYYNISFSKIKLKIYSKRGTNLINYTYTSDMVETNQNFDSMLSIINGDYIYQIKITNVYNNYQAYYVKFTLFEI